MDEDQESLDEFASETRPILDLIAAHVAALEAGTADRAALVETRGLFAAIEGRAAAHDLARLNALARWLLALTTAHIDEPGDADLARIRALCAGFDRLSWQVDVLRRLRHEAPGDDSDLLGAEGELPTPLIAGSAPDLAIDAARPEGEVSREPVPVPRPLVVALVRAATEAATARRRMALPAGPETGAFDGALEALCRAAFELRDGAMDFAAAEGKGQARDPGEPLRVLLVDDEAFFRDLLGRTLIGAGHVVTTAASAREAFALVAAGPAPDAVVTDLDMPETDGFGLARALLAHPRRRGLPMVGLAPHAAPQLFVEARAAGLRRIVGKFDRDALLRWLAEDVTPAASLRSRAA